MYILAQHTFLSVFLFKATRFQNRTCCVKRVHISFPTTSAGADASCLKDMGNSHALQDNKFFIVITVIHLKQAVVH